MAYSIRLPDGTLVRNIPDELSPQEAKERIIKAYPEYAPDSGVLRQAADIPVQVGRGAVMGIRMLADTLGADNPVSNALRGAEDYLGDLLSAEAKRDQKEIARILKDAEDKGVLDQVKAGLEALTVAPVDLVSQVLGTAAPTIAAGMAGAAAKLGAVGVRTLQAGTGAAMGTGLAKGNIYDVVKEELQAAGVDEKIAEERAKAAQSYTGENWDQIIFGGALGGAAALGPLERIFARVPSISPQVAAKNIFARAGAAGVAEAVPEAAQAFQEQVAQNIALQREGFDVPTFRGAVANATLEGLAGFGIGAPIGALEGKPAAQQPPGQQQTEPTPPAGAAPAEGIPLPPEEQLTPEEEAELQARIAATQLPPPPAAPVVAAPQPQPPLPPAPAAVEPEQPIGPMPEVEEEQITVPPTTEEVTQGLPATPQTKSLTDQLAQVRAARMDPMLTPEDPAFLELDRREQEILAQIEQMTAGVQIGQVPPTEPGVQIGQMPPAAPPLQLPTPPTPPVITPPAAITPEITAPEEPVIRSKDEVQAEINRVRQSMKRAQTAVNKGQLPEAEVTKLQERMTALEAELDAAKAGKRKPKYRSADGKTWIGTGAIPGWLNTKLQQGFELSDFEIRPELGDKSEVEVELEKPPGFGRRMPPTRPPEEYEALSRQIDQAETETPNLFTLLKGQLTDTEVNDISPEKSFSFLRAGKGKGTDLSELVSGDTLVDYLPDELQPGAPTFDAGEAAEYIKDLLRQDPATNPEARLSYYTREVLIPSLRQELDLLEQTLEPEDVNQLIQEIIAEERAAIADIEAGAIAEQERGPAVPPVTDEFALTGQTPEELAELQRREESGEAEAERERLEAEEAARAAAEAERKIADQKRETFQLAPPPSAPAARAAAPSGDLFGTAGITEQPTRAPRQVAAEPSPIEQMAEDARAAEEMGSPQQVLDELVKELGRGVGKRRIETPDATTILTEETWDGDTTIKRFEFDAIVSLASKSDTARGAKYSILIKNTPTESITLTFQPRGLKPLDRTVGMKYVLSKTTLDTEVPPLEDAIIERMRQLGVADLDAASKKVQEAYGVSKPVADAYVRAVRKQAEAVAKSSYGKATENEFQDAYDEAQKLLNRIKGISKRKEPKAEKKEEKPVGPTPGEIKNIQYWQENVAPAIRDYLEAYKTVGVERLERSNVKPAGISAKEWLIQLRDQESKFEKGRKVSETGIQMLSKKDLWPTETGDGEVLRKAMLKAIRELKKAPGYSSNWIDNMELGSYDGVSGYAPVEDKTVFGIAADGIDGYEIDPSIVPNGSDAFQYVVGRVEKDGKEEVYRRRADERGTYGGWRVETSVDKLIPKKPSTKKTREVAEGTVVERIELPENLEIRIVKLKDGYSVYQYDLDGDQIVMGEQRQFRAPAFPKDQDAYRAAEAFASDMFDKAVPKQPEKMKAAMQERLSRGEDVINNKTPDPDIPADQRLVLMSCCATKNKAMGMGPAMDVYTGVFFQTFKNKVKEGAMPNVRILSAKYGFIKPDQRIGIYDQVMDKETADKFMVDDKLVEGFPSNIKDVLIVGSDQYQRVMKAAIEDLIKEGKIDKGASINITKGGIGEQRAQLGKYLSSLKPKPRPTPGTAEASESIGRAYDAVSGMLYRRSYATTLDNQHRTRLINALKDQGYTATDAKDIVEEAVRIKASRNMPMDFLQPRDLQEAGRVLNLQEVPGKEKPKPEKFAMRVIKKIPTPANQVIEVIEVSDTEHTVRVWDNKLDRVDRTYFEKFKGDDSKEKALAFAEEVSEKLSPKAEPAKFGPTITEIMAETEELRKKAAEMGIETTYVPKPDTSKREAREKKEREDIQRLASERIRLEKLTKEPIKGTPEQRSAAERLARSVNGELLFLDGSRGLGIVFGKDRNGEDAYLPIYEGKISRVDVRDFTGLKTTDKEYLKQVRSELMRDAGARQKRKDEEAGWEFMLKGTEDQQKGVRAVAETLGGTPVYFDPETNVGLVRGYGVLSGKPVYAMTMGDRYSTADVEESTVSLFAPYKAQLIEVKKRLEKDAEQKHKDDPFITFDKGMAMSEGIDPALREIITEWKSMLGLGNVNIYFSTIEDAKKNRENFTGPHRVVGSGTLDANEGGSMRRMPDGSYYVLFKKSTSKTSMLETIAHELGHVHEREAYQNAPQELKDKLKQAHAKWVQERKGKTAREAVDMLRAKTTAQTTRIAPGKDQAAQLSPYWSSFSEWYADQVSRWAVTDEKPVGVVEKFFARLGAALRRFYQTLKGKKFLPDETFVQYLNQVKPTIVEEIPGPIKEPVQIEMSFQMQKDLFGSTQEAKDIERVMEVKGKKLPPGRSPELTAAAQAVKAGTLTAAEYNKLVDTYKPIPLYAEPLKPATSEQVFDALDVKKREQINPEIPNGTKVGLRLDIPAFNRKGVFVVSIHQKRTASAPGKVIGYGSVAKAKNVTFGVGNQLKALEIAAGSAKDALQTMEGEYVNTTPEQAFAEAQRAIKDPNYVQIGIDPTRHAYFYDRRTTLPVVAAEEVIQIGNMILAKKPTFGSKADFLYNIDASEVAGDTRPDDMSFLDRLREESYAKRDQERQENIAYYASIRQKQANLMKQVAKYGSTLDIQRQLTNLNELAKTLKEDIDLDRRPTYTAENFMRQARAAVDGTAPYKEQAIDPDVFAVIQAVYMDDPKLLEGLRLSIKPEFNARDEELRKAFGLKASAGAFETTRRIVHLYTGTKGVTEPTTIRHELVHTLEQMMTGKQRQAVINSYLNALQKAIRRNKDPRAQKFFENVIAFHDNPSEKAAREVERSLPSLDLYQFVNASEYWAVNAEKLMAQRLGVPWDRFKKAVRKIFEKLKSFFGFDDGFAVHEVFDQIMSGSKKRLDRESLAAYMGAGNAEFTFLKNVEEDAELVRRYQRPDTPMLDHSPTKRLMVNAVSFAKDEFKNMAENPSDALRMMFNSLNRGVMYLRNKNIWFGSGINEADRIRYNGQVKTAEGLATASLALDNMLRGGNIATQALFLGGVEFNKKTLQYTAARKDKNMTKVYEAEARLKEKLGEQLGTNIIQGYLEAKRSRSIKDEVEIREMRVEFLAEQIDEAVLEMKRMDADPKTTKDERDKADRELRKLFKEYRNEKKSFEDMKKLAEEKVTMSDMEIDEFISREEAHPELREIIENFNAVNQNLLKFWREVGLLSDARYNALASIKDYVPWYRIMNDEEDVHSPLQATTRSATNIGREKLFKSGKPSVINDFIVEENQDVFRIQPSRVNAVKLNGVKLKPDAYEALPNGEVRLKVDYKPGDVVVIETQREIENMIDNMTRNVMRMTMNGLRQYAASRIVSEYATRDQKGQIMIFPKVDREKGRFDYIHDGRRYVVEIQDPLLAEAAYGMETVGMEMWKPLAAAANFTRRTITLSPVFQLKQVFKDAPTAALVTGVKNPAALIGGVYKGFVDAVRDSDPAASILREAGIGGFYSPARTPEADVKRQIGIINNSTYDYVIKALDHWGDSSDMAQRIAIYNRVMKETGDEALAMYQSANVINFLRHGSGQLAQALVKTVPFLNAYAQSIDVLYNALVGGGLRGKDRTAALKQLAVTGSLLAGTAILYTLLVGDDDDYQKLDDQTKVRNLIIPGTDVILPMNTSAAFFFKAIPELITNKIINEGTKNEVDAARLRTALKESAIDLLLGPTPIPSAVKPVIEISLDYNFFTSRSITPRGMDNLDAYQQYDMRTSEAAKLLSGLTGTEANRLLNPMEADHLIRSIFGTAGAMVAWSSNVIGEGSAYRPEMTIKEMPVVGAFLRPEIPRGREDLFYRLKDATDRKYRTFQRIVERGNMAEADAYMKRYPNLIAFYDYTTDMANDLKDINAAIRYIGEVKDPSFTPERKRREIQQLMELKQNALEGIEQFRKEAYAD